MENQKFYYDNKIVKYFSFIGKALGFNVVKGISVTNLEPVSFAASRGDGQRLCFFAS